jgi:hypothetical protein
MHYSAYVPGCSVLAEVWCASKGTVISKVKRIETSLQIRRYVQFRHQRLRMTYDTMKYQILHSPSYNLIPYLCGFGLHTIFMTYEYMLYYCVLVPL